MQNPPATPRIDPPADAVLPPSRARYGVLGFLCSLSFVLYLDRVCIGQAVPSIKHDLGLTNTQIGYALGAFTIAYGLFEVPTGWWGDRFGSRRVLTRIVVWWSVFTALTGAVSGLGMLIAVRFLFGAGEAGAYPNAIRVVARWFPLRERGFAQGTVIMSAQLGGALAPLIAAALIESMGWRRTFVVFSLIGVAWAVAFYYWFRDEPADHAWVNASERHLIDTGGAALAVAEAHPDLPWKAMLGNPTILLLGLYQTCSSLLSYMFMGWYPTYLEKGREVAPMGAGQLTSIVLAGSAVGCLASGFLNDWLARITNRHPDRFRWFGATTTLLAAAALFVGVRCESATATSLWGAIAFMLVISQQATVWAVTTEVAGPHLGAVFGLVNSMGIPGAFISSVFLGRFVDWMGSRGYEGRAQWDPAFYAYVAVLVLGSACWIFIDARRRLSEPLPTAQRID